MPRVKNVSLPQLFGEARSDYAASKESRFRRRRQGVPVSGSGGDYHYRNDGDYLKILEYARDMDRNDMILGQMVDRAVTNEIGDGFRLDPRTGDDKLNMLLTEKWNRFAGEPESCDIAGELVFPEMEWMVSRACKVDGDMIAIPRHIDDGGQIRLVEGHRIRTPYNARRSMKHRNVIHGVRLAEGTRQRTEYLVTREDVDPDKQIRNVKDVRMYRTRDSQGNRQVCHMHQSKRISQTRGVSAFAPMFDLCGMFDDINFAKLVQQQVVSCFAVIRTKQPGFSASGGSGGDPRGETTTDQFSDGGSRTLVGVSPGMEIVGQEGEDIQGFSPNITSSEFFDHMWLLITFMGANLGMPPGVAVLDPKQSNLSSWRGVVDEARRGYRNNQNRLMRRFHSPMYKIKVRQWIAEDPLIRGAYNALGDNLFNHVWHPPRWPYIEPLKDAKTEELQLARNLASRTEIAKGKGHDVDVQDKEIVTDNGRLIRMAKEEAKSINKDYPDDAPVAWTDVLNPQSAQVIDSADPDYQGNQAENTSRENGA